MGILSLSLIGLLTMSSPLQSADDRELLEYRLTPAVLTKVEAVAKAFDANIAKDPQLKRVFDAQREIAALEKKSDTTDLTEAEEKRLEALERIVAENPIDLGINGGSLSEMSAQLQKVPAMAAALKSAGMLPRDMAKFIVTAVQAAMVGGLTGMPVPPGAAGDNVRFVTANQAAIERINTLLGAR
jgi:hypothetical protein